jgi:predicted DNA-binding protein with PD1-like motif
MTVSTSSARHLLLRFTQPARLPEAVLAALRDEVVLAGWMRASGILSDVEVAVVDSRAAAGATSTPRKIDGPVQVIALEGSVGLAGGDVSCGLRIVLARVTDSGVETIAGDLVSGQIEALEVMITAFDDVTATRELDRAGVWVLDATEGAERGARPSPAAAALPTAATAPAPAPAPAPASPPPQPVMPSPTQSGFAEVSRAPVETPRAAPPMQFGSSSSSSSSSSSPKPSPTFSAMNQAMPQRIARPVQVETEDDPVPEPGDIVEHFAFGRCEVVKSEGDRLHVRLGKDQRIKEIALEMLKVSALPLEEGQTTNHWKLARKL